MKVEGNHLAISAKEFIWQTIYLKHGKMQRSRTDKNVVVTVFRRDLLSLNIEERKNNAIYML